METEHVIADELLDAAKIALLKKEVWVAYNDVPYFLEKGDMYFFKLEDEAREFSENNVSEYDNYTVITIHSAEDLLRQIVYGKSDFLTLNDTVMNEKNLDYLKTNVRNLGFGDSLAPELEAQIKKQPAEFTLAYKTEVNKREIEATLHFRKSDTTDMYFLNKYDTRLQNEKGETMAQTFYLNNGWGVTLKEAYNLLNGRAVHKELSTKAGESYKAWIQLDFTVRDKGGNYARNQYHQNYGFDLKEALSYFPVKEMRNDEDAKMLLRSLERGNVQSATIVGVDNNAKVFLEANPQYKSIKVYDEGMKLLGKEQRAELMIKPATMEQREGKTEKQELGQEDQPGKKSVKARRNETEDKGMVTKKRERSGGKSLGV